ncbi:MAG TPA: tetratricopeptide repeat protein [Methylophilaceae bacterium]|nr:tetratricopeptide repeat protein [Methylophilaceae bacterium]
MPVSRIYSISLTILLSLHLMADACADDLRDISRQASQGQQAAALERINNYLSKNPSDVQAMFIRGVILADQGRRDEAIKVFTEITEKHPGLPEPYNNLAVLYADQGQYEKARKALETAIKTHPSYATAHENLGDIYARMASEAYDKALQLDTGNARAQNKLAMIKDLFSTSTDKPTMLAAKSPAAAKPPAGADKATPATPIRSAENKPVEPKPAAAVAATDNAKPAPIKKAEPVNAAALKPEPTKPEAAKPEPAKQAAAKPEQQATANGGQADLEKEAMAAVNAWARAWSSKDVDRYLASYAESFQTPDGQTRQQWEALRRERISKPARISVELSNIRTKLSGPDQARVSFKQRYQAGGTSMRTSKSLVLKKNKGQWLIEQELTDR